MIKFAANNGGTIHAVSTSTMHLSKFHCNGDGLVVSVLAFYSDDPSSIPTESLVNCLSDQK